MTRLLLTAGTSLLFAFAITQSAFAQTTHSLVDFDNTSDLTTLFNPDASPQFTNIADQGIGNTGSIDVPIGSTDIWTTKVGYSVSGAGDVYTLSAFFKIKENDGYGGLGFSPSDVNESDFVGSPEFGLGMAFHGGGGMFINNRVQTPVDWPPDLVLGNWYKMILKVTAKGSNLYDMDFQIWNSDADGNLGAMKTEQTLTDVFNAEVGGASTIHVYFSAAGSRMEKIDNFDIHLEGGSVIVEAGAPVVLTDTVSSITATTALCGGNVTDDRDSAVTARGVCWSTTPEPTTSLGTKTSDGTGTGPFTSSLTGLAAGTTYYVRAYATNGVGTSYGAEMLFTTPAINNCLHFDGIDDFVNIGDVDALDGTSSLTIEMWVNIETWDTWKTFFSKNGTGGRIQFQLFDTPGDLGVIVESNGYFGGYGYTTTHPVYTGEWFHLAMVYDGNGATDGDKLKLYINGAFQTLSFFSDGVPPTTPSTTAPVLLGAETIAEPYGFNGQMDEVRIWSTARTETEIQNNMNASLTGNESGLLMYYQFNQGTGGGSNGGVTTLIDETANHYDGALTNFALTGSSSNWLTRTFTTPTTQANNISAVGNGSTQVDLTWTNGSGSNRIVFMKQTGALESPAPVSNTVYAANAVFGSGAEIGSSGWFCVYDGNENAVTVSGLSESTPYRIMVCEYNINGSAVNYAVNAGVNNPVQFVTPLPIQLASFTATVTSQTSIRLDWITVSEINNYGFFIQRKLQNDSNWVMLQNSYVPGHGTTNDPHSYSFTDNAVIAGALQYRLKQVDLDGSVHFSEPVSVGGTTGVGGEAPTVFALEQNYPNPFNPVTTIQYAIPVGTYGHMSLRVYDVLGREVATLVQGVVSPGVYTVRFDGNNLSSGIYFYRLVAGSKVATQRMMLMR